MWDLFHHFFLERRPRRPRAAPLPHPRPDLPSVHIHASRRAKVHMLHLKHLKHLSLFITINSSDPFHMLHNAVDAMMPCCAACPRASGAATQTACAQPPDFESAQPAVSSSDRLRRGLTSEAGLGGLRSVAAWDRRERRRACAREPARREGRERAQRRAVGEVAHVVWVRAKDEVLCGSARQGKGVGGAGGRNGERVSACSACARRARQPLFPRGALAPARMRADRGLRRG